MTDSAVIGEVLVVDDHPDSLHLLAGLLGGAGYAVRQAPNGELALWSALRQPPDLIILDVRMPGMNGFDVCRCLRQQPGTALVPVIFLSATTDSDDRIAGFDAGAVDFISKPFVDGEVLARVRTHISMALTAKRLLQRHRQRDSDSPRPPPGKAIRPTEILIVEDTPASLQLLATLLSQAGYTVREAPNGELALWSASRHPPDLILLDIRMPGMNGFDVCRGLKLEPATAQVPVIFLSASADAEDKATGFAVGAVDFISKPFVEQEVLARVRTHLRLAADYAIQSSPAPVGDWAGAMPDSGPSQTAELENAFTASQQAILVSTAEGRIASINPAFTAWLGYTLADLQGLHWPDALVESVAATGADDSIVQVVGKGGQRELCRLNCSPITGAGGQLLRQIVVVQPLQAPAAASAAASAATSPAWPVVDAGGDFPVSAENLEQRLRSAVAQNELELLYQPMICLQSGRLAGAEALLRWNLAGVGTLPPARFLTLAEETGEILAIGAWTLRSVCASLDAWRDALPPGFKLVINLSSLQFWQDSLPEMIRQALAAHGVAAGFLQLDITENTLHEDPSQALAVLQRLKALGVSIALDSFGVCPTRLSSLHRLPVDCFKIDSTLIKDMSDDDASLALVTSIIDMAHLLHRQALAKGIERPAQGEQLRALRCDLCQGYGSGEPLPAAGFLARYLTHHGKLQLSEP